MNGINVDQYKYNFSAAQRARFEQWLLANGIEPLDFLCAHAMGDTTRITKVKMIPGSQGNLVPDLSEDIEGYYVNADVFDVPSPLPRELTAEVDDAPEPGVIKTRW